MKAVLSQATYIAIKNKFAQKKNLSQPNPLSTNIKDKQFKTDAQNLIQ